MSEDRATVLNYGGGTQTVALCVLIARGVLPKPDHIVMADTSREVLSTFRYLDEHTRPFMKTHGLSIEVAPHSLATVDLYSHKGTLLIPAFTQTGKFSSYCSGEWKASVVERYLRSKGVKRAEQWIGYSLDEKKRWSAPRDKSGPWVLRFPLVELLATRDDCERIITEAGLPLPHKSRCWMCPNQSNAEWRELRDKSPEEFAAAVRLDEQIREEDEEHGFYVHESRQPLSVANIDVPDRKTKERRVSEKWSDQYGIPCIAVESPDFVNVDALIARCEEIGAVRKVDGIEFCVELRDEVGPELWTEDSLRRSTGKGLVAEAGAENVRTQAEKDAAELTYTIRVSRYFRRD